MTSRFILTKVRVRGGDDDKRTSLSPIEMLFSKTFLLTLLVLLFEIDATNYTQLWNDMRQEISLVIGPKSALPGQGSFGHITGGYDAGAFYVAKLCILAASEGEIDELPRGKRLLRLHVLPRFRRGHVCHGFQEGSTRPCVGREVQE